MARKVSTKHALNNGDILQLAGTEIDHGNLNETSIRFMYEVHGASPEKRKRGSRRTVQILLVPCLLQRRRPRR